ncbi:cyclic nucleotide-binding protein [Fibrisoma limi BUZ 3]|uniref:Cyclic nucleotide-binding protein n=1 Tax=Fibrisoma limi BUZ 3 TaxID=1185876 RepID=I2GDV0_9BACT|nr:Crp/Fnr family transcriptional regulator [Fibrisoma limi]CCH52074.1 cyclic nucleotide-binding protein [Fibrisoma limi BUZ 3]
MQRVLFNVYRIVKPTDEEKAAFERILHPRILAKDGLYVGEGDICSTIAFIEKGCGRLYYEFDGWDVSKEFVFENGLLGSFVSFFSQRPANVNVAALEETHILEMQYDDVMQLCGTYPVWQRFGVVLLQDQLTRLERRETSLLKDAPEERYRRLLTEHPKVLKRIPPDHIASYLGITPETLSLYQSRQEPSAQP